MIRLVDNDVVNVMNLIINQKKNSRRSLYHNTTSIRS